MPPTNGSETGAPLPHLFGRYPANAVWAGFLLVNAFITIMLMALLAVATGSPLMFPSLGPTALLLFSDPLQRAASPRSAVCGHAIGILCGYGSLMLLGLSHHPSTVTEGVLMERVFASALALASTGVLTKLFDVWHPPAGATTLIIALGIITRPRHLLFIEMAVILLVIQAFVINNVAGISYPMWTPARMTRKNVRDADNVSKRGG